MTPDFHVYLNYLLWFACGFFAAAIYFCVFKVRD